MSLINNLRLEPPTTPRKARRKVIEDSRSDCASDSDGGAPQALKTSRNVQPKTPRRKTRSGRNELHSSFSNSGNTPRDNNYSDEMPQALVKPTTPSKQSMMQLRRRQADKTDRHSSNDSDDDIPLDVLRTKWKTKATVPESVSRTNHVIGKLPPSESVNNASPSKRRKRKKAK